MPARKRTPYGKVYRQLVEYEDKMTQLELWRMNLVPPSVGIFDEPNRCYKLNNEWAKIVIGMVSWLAETPVWKDAENEGYSAIEQILKFMIGEDCVDCQFIIDCINDPNSGVADSINNIIRPNTQQDSRDYGQSQSGTLLGDGNNTLCNLDVWYGGILNLVEQLNTNNEDALQVFEVVTNINELFANVVGSITGIDESSIDAVLQWITFIQQSIMENYVAQWTTAYRDAVVCDLFCMVKDTCELTPTMLYDYFLGRLNGQLQYESLLDQTLNFLVTGLWTGTEIVDAMMLSQIGFRAQLGKWFDFIGFNSIDVDLRLGFSNPSNNWQLLCTCPNFWAMQWLNGDGDPTLNGWTLTYGTYNTGQDRLDETFINSSSDGVRAVFVIPAGKVGSIKQITMSYDVQAQNFVRTQSIRIYDEFGVQQEIASVVKQTGTGTVTWTGDVAYQTNWEIWLQVATATNGGTPNHAWITKMTIDGEGNNLFI